MQIRIDRGPMGNFYGSCHNGILSGYIKNNVPNNYVFYFKTFWVKFNDYYLAILINLEIEDDVSKNADFNISPYQRRFYSGKIFHIKNNLKYNAVALSSEPVQSMMLIEYEGRMSFL